VAGVFSTFLRKNIFEEEPCNPRLGH